MIRFVPRPGETTRLYCPIGLRLVDDFTGGGPIGWVRARLDILDGTNWRPTDIQAVFTPGGVVAYPGLGRVADPAGKPPRKYQVRLEAEFYRPLYPLNQQGHVFAVYPYNDDNPPQLLFNTPWRADLFPAPNYPFPAEVPVVRGKVVDAVGLPVEDATVSDDNRQRVLTDGKGQFALPLRRARAGGTYAIDADHEPTNRTGTISVTIPASQGQTIPIA